jgi:hypothetical protein
MNAPTLPRSTNRRRALPSARRLGFEGAIAIAGHVDGHRANVVDRRLGAGAVAGVPAVAAGRIVLAIAEVRGPLDLQARLQDELGDLRQHAVGADQLLALGPGLLHRLFRQPSARVMPLVDGLGQHGLFSVFCALRGGSSSTSSAAPGTVIASAEASSVLPGQTPGGSSACQARPVAPSI